MDGHTEHFSAQLVARGFKLVWVHDYNLTFALVGKYTTTRVLHAIAAAREYEILLMDISNAFLHGELDKEVYLAQSEG